MLHALIETEIKPKLQALNTIARLGGLVKNVSRTVEDGEGRQIRQSFPVSCNTSYADCWNGGRYQSLVPDSSVASVVYFEETACDVSADEPNRRLNTMRYGMRLCAWFNLALLGWDECNVPASIVNDMMNAVRGVYMGPYDKCVSEVKATSINQRTPQAVFGKYTFGAREDLFMYPYAFCAIDFDVRMEYPPACLPTFEPSTPITCVTL